MKRFVLIVTLLLTVSALGNADEKKGKVVDYVITEQDTLFCDQVREGLTHLIVCSGNERNRLNYSDVKAYRSQGDLYVRKQLPNSDKYAFVQVVSQKWNLQLVKCPDYFSCGQGNQQNPAVQLYVYDGNRFLTAINEQNQSHLLDLFHVHLTN